MSNKAGAGPADEPIRVEKILVATDFSEASRAMLPYVREVAAHYGAEVTIAHIAGASFTPSEEAKLIQAAQGRMREFLAKVPEAAGYRQVVKTGEAADAVASNCSESGIDLLVLGTNGRRGIKRFMLGSVAEEIFRTATCPVLTVGPKARGRAPAIPLRRILFATDLTPVSLAALPWTMRLAAEHGAVLTLLHVGDARELALAEPRLEDLADQGRAQNVKIDVRLASGAAAEEILEAASEIDPDLIVLGVRGGGAYRRAATHAPGPVAYNVLAQAECPVLTIRSRESGIN
jgi:nucleotide-binding universal stress UspA family protein